MHVLFGGAIHGPLIDRVPIKGPGQRDKSTLDRYRGGWGRILVLPPHHRYRIVRKLAAIQINYKKLLACT